MPGIPSKRAFRFNEYSRNEGHNSPAPHANAIHQHKIIVSILRKLSYHQPSIAGTNHPGQKNQIGQGNIHKRAGLRFFIAIIKHNGQHAGESHGQSNPFLHRKLLLKKNIANKAVIKGDRL